MFVVVFDMDDALGDGPRRSGRAKRSAPCRGPHGLGLAVRDSKRRSSGRRNADRRPPPLLSGGVLGEDAGDAVVPPLLDSSSTGVSPPSDRERQPASPDAPSPSGALHLDVLFASGHADVSQAVLLPLGNEHHAPSVDVHPSIGSERPEGRAMSDSGQRITSFSPDVTGSPSSGQPDARSSPNVMPSPPSCSPGSCGPLVRAARSAPHRRTSTSSGVRSMARSSQDAFVSPPRAPSGRFVTAGSAARPQGVQGSASNSSGADGRSAPDSETIAARYRRILSAEHDSLHAERDGGVRTPSIRRVGEQRGQALQDGRGAAQVCEGSRAQEDDKHASLEHLSELDSCSRAPPPISASVKDIVRDAMRARLWGPAMSEQVCGVCDRLVTAAKSSWVALHGSLLTMVLRRLRLPDDLCEDVRLQYDCSSVLGMPELSGVALSPRGVRCVEQLQELCLCSSCHRSLARVSGKPPRHAIANGFYIGVLPCQMLDSTWLEMKLMSMVSVRMSVGVVRGGANRVIRSHVSLFDARPSAVVTQLPRVLDEASDSFMVIMAGLFTSAQDLAVRRAHRVRGERLRQLFDFFSRFNEVFRTLDVTRRSDAFVDQEPVIERDVDRQVASSTPGSGYVGWAATESDVPLDRAVAADQSNVRQRSDADVAQTPAEELLVRVAAGVHIDTEGPSRVERLAATSTRDDGRTTSGDGGPVVIRQGGLLVSDRTPHLFAMMFPGLFPYGRGDPDEKRHVRMSRMHCLRHYLQLSTRRFAQDTVFPLVAFDFMSRHLSLSRASLYCRLSSAEQNAAIAGVSVDELAALLEYDSSCLAAARSNVARPPMPASIGNAKVLTNRVRSAAAHAKGTNAAREAQRRRGFCLQTRFGSPYVFVTLSPKDNGSLTVAYLAGDVPCERLADLTMRDLPTQAERFASTAKDPVAAARYFHRTVEAFFEEAVGFDVAAQRPLARGGIFGHAKAYIGGVETQGDGTLHLHALVWLHGTPISLSQLRVKLLEEQYRDAFVAFSDSVQQHTVPLTVPTTCEACDGAGSTLVSVTPGSAAFSKGGGDQAPATARCTACAALYGHGDLVARALRDAIRDLLGLGSSHVDFEAHLRPLVNLPPQAWGCVPVGKVAMEDPDSQRRQVAEAIITTYLVVHCNLHLWQHCDSCFKKSRRTSDMSGSVCRYLFPRPPVAFSAISNDVEVVSKRMMGSEYVNSFSSTIMLALPTNHDVRLLAGPNAMYYALKYALKDQQQITNSALLVEAFKRRLDRDAALLPAAPGVAASRRVCSLVYAATKTQEIAAPLAVHYLLGGDGVYVSHTFAPLMLGQAIDVQGGQEVECHVGRSGAGISITSGTSDYALRPAELERVSLYMYVTRYVKGPLSTRKAASPGIEQADAIRAMSGAELDDDEAPSSRGQMRLMSGHPQEQTHCVVRRPHEVVPDILGPRIPNKRGFAQPPVSDAEQEAANLYALVALILFRPYRNRFYIKSDCASMWEMFIEWEAALRESSDADDKMALDVLENAQDYYDAKEAAKESSERQQQDLQQRFSDVFHADGDGGADDGIVPADDNEDPEKHLDPGEPCPEESVVDCVSEAWIRRRRRIESAGPDVMRACDLANLSGVSKDVGSHSVVGDERARVSVSTVTAAVDRARRGEAVVDAVDSEVPGNSGHVGSGDELGQGGGGISIVELLSEALRKRHQLEDVPAPELAGILSRHEASSFLSLEDVSVSAGLNAEQHVSFCMAGEVLLKDFRDGVSGRERSSESLRMILHGEGGTGKSRVLSCLTTLCKSWQRSRALVLLAPTGIAAANIGGQTLHSATGLGSWQPKAGSTKSGLGASKRKLDELIKKWASVRMVAIDESSMMDKELLNAVDRRLQLVKEDGHACGGLHVVLCGDFTQLPPVVGQPLYNAAKKTGVRGVAEQAGYDLYRSFCAVVVLTKNMRAAADPEWAGVLKRMRLGSGTRSDSAFLRGLVGTPERLQVISEELSAAAAADIPLSENAPLPPLCPVIVATNAERYAIIWSVVQAVGSRSIDVRRRPLLIPAVFSGSARQARPCADTLEALYGLDDVHRLMPVLPIVHNMAYMVSYNVCVSLKVANGTLCYPVMAQFPSTCTFDERYIGDAVFDMASGPAEVIWARIPGRDFSSSFSHPDGVPTDAFPFTPELASGPVQLPHRSFSVSLSQFPLAPACAITVFKCQSLTLPAIAISRLRAPRSRMPRTALYVASSRSRLSERTIFLHPISPSDSEYFRPPDTLLRELERLRVLSVETMATFGGD